MPARTTQTTSPSTHPKLLISTTITPQKHVHWKNKAEQPSPLVGRLRQLILKSHQEAAATPSSSSSSSDHRTCSKTRYLLQSPTAAKLGLVPQSSSSLSSSFSYRQLWSTSPSSPSSSSPLTTVARVVTPTTFTTTSTTSKDSDKKSSDNKTLKNQTSNLFVSPLVSTQSTNQQQQRQKANSSNSNNKTDITQTPHTKTTRRQLTFSTQRQPQQQPKPKSRTNMGSKRLSLLSNKHAAPTVPPIAIPSGTTKRHTTLKDSTNNKLNCGGGIAQAQSKPTLTLPLAPRQWTHGQLFAWLQTKKLHSPARQLPPHVNGKAIMRMTKVQLAQSLSMDTSQADALYRRLRAETDHVDRLALKQRAARRQNQS